MKNEENEVQTDLKAILKTCSCFYTELYSSTLQDQHPSLKYTSADTPPIMTSEVKNPLKEMKNNKTPGTDNLTCDVMTPRGKESTKQQKNKQNRKQNKTKTKNKKQKKNENIQILDTE